MEKRSVTILDVAARAGVSISTVSRVLNDTGYPMRPDTKTRVQEAIDALGFHPSPLARGLLGKPTQTIGLLIPDISNPYYPQLSRGVEDAASEQGYTVMFCNTDRNPTKLRSYLEVLRDKQVDGVIFAGGGIENDNELSMLPEGISHHVVLIGRHGLPFPSVQVDNVQAAYEATIHLAGLGHKRIAFITGPMNVTSVRDRLKGYRKAMAEIGTDEADLLVREGDFHSESSYQATCSLLELDPCLRPSAVFAANDRMAFGAMAAAFDSGRRVPDDLAVVGFDDTPAAQYVRPSLTTVALPSYEIGSTAARMLFRVLAGETVQDTVWLPTRLVIRESSGDITQPATIPCKEKS